MSHAKPVSKSKSRNKVGPALGAAGLSLSLAGGASATTGGLTAHMLTPNNEASQEISLGEEEIFDVTLATFYVVNKEHSEFQPSRRLAMGGGGGCGCCAACAAATGNYGAWTPESDGHLSQRSIKPAHPPKRTHVFQKARKKSNLGYDKTLGRRSIDLKSFAILQAARDPTRDDQCL